MPKEFFEYAKKQGAETVDLEFTDLRAPGVTDNCVI